MTELTVEEIQEPTPQPVSEEPPEPEPPGEPPELRREPPEVQAEEPAEEPPAPKRRGRPAGSKNKPKAIPKRRALPTPELEPSEIEPPPQIDIDALLQPIFRAYMATGELRKRQARQQRYDSLFQGMVG